MIHLDYDIVVCGAGPAGVAAAIAARTDGAKVLLIERDGVPGGMATSGLLNNWCGDADSKYFRRILQATQPVCEGSRRQYSPEALKLFLIEDIEASGAELLLHALVSGAAVEDGTLKSVRLSTKSGDIEVSAKVFVDATGDGDVAAYCGVPARKGRDEDGLMQPMTVEYEIGGVAPDAVFAKTPETAAKLKEYADDGRVPFPVSSFIVLRGIEPGTAFVNMTNVIHADGTDVFAWSKAEIEARKQIPKITQFLRECVPGFENCFTLTSAAYAGVRESRRVQGLYTITEEDVRTGRVFDDRITNGVTYVFGVHDPTGGVKKSPTPKYERKYYTIPYGSVVPVGMKNLLLGGRCISGTHLAHSSYRVMPICFAIGEGVGHCAAVAVRYGTSPCTLTPEQIREVQSRL